MRERRLIVTGLLQAETWVLEVKETQVERQLHDDVDLHPMNLQMLMMIEKRSLVLYYELRLWDAGLVVAEIHSVRCGEQSMDALRVLLIELVC